MLTPLNIEFGVNVNSFTSLIISRVYPAHVQEFKNYTDPLGVKIEKYFIYTKTTFKRNMTGKNEIYKNKIKDKKTDRHRINEKVARSCTSEHRNSLIFFVCVLIRWIK